MLTVFWYMEKGEGNQQNDNKKHHKFNILSKIMWLIEWKIMSKCRFVGKSRSFVTCLRWLPTLNSGKLKITSDDIQKINKKLLFKSTKKKDGKKHFLTLDNKTFTVTLFSLYQKENCYFSVYTMLHTNERLH